MKKLLLAIYLTLMVSTLNGETVKKENVKWIKLEDYYDGDIENIGKGIVYQGVNGKNYKCGEIINGNLEGKWIYWYKNGQKESEGYYKNGEKEGKWIHWYDNGQKMLEGDYIEGKEDGKWSFCDITGYKYMEITYKNGECIDWIYLKKNGERKEILTTTKAGVKIIRLLDKNTLDKDMRKENIFVMNLLLLGLMQNTKKGIVYQEINGKDYKYGEIKDGRKNGKWTSWYENGKKKVEAIFKDDEEIKRIKYDENGNRIEE